MVQAKGHLPNRVKPYVRVTEQECEALQRYADLRDVSLLGAIRGLIYDSKLLRRPSNRLCKWCNGQIAMDEFLHVVFCCNECRVKQTNRKSLERYHASPEKRRAAAIAYYWANAERCRERARKRYHAKKAERGG